MDFLKTTLIKFKIFSPFFSSRLKKFNLSWFYFIYNIKVTLKLIIFDKKNLILNRFLKKKKKNKVTFDFRKHISLNLFVKFFFLLYRNFLFFFSLTFYSAVLLFNSFFLLFKYFYSFYLNFKQYSLKKHSNTLNNYSFFVFFIFVNFLKRSYKFVSFFLFFILFFYLFKINYFNLDFFYVHYKEYLFVENYQFGNFDLIYNKFSLWWLIRIYMFYFFLYIFLKDFRTLIFDNLKYLLVLPFLVFFLNFRFLFYTAFINLSDKFTNMKKLLPEFYFHRINHLKNRPSYFLTKPKSLGLFSSFDFNANDNKFLEFKNNPKESSSKVLNLNYVEGYKFRMFAVRKLKVVNEYYSGFRLKRKLNSLDLSLPLVNDCEIKNFSELAKTTLNSEFFFYPEKEKFYTSSFVDSDLDFLSDKVNGSNYLFYEKQKNRKNSSIKHLGTAFLTKFEK